MQENMKKKKNAGRNAMSSAASTAFLRWAADSEWVTQRALMLWPGTRNWKNRKIHGLVEERKLREMNLKEKVKEKNQEMRRTRKREPGIPGDVWGKRYALGSEGRQFLRERNPKRYYTELKENDVSYEIRKVYRMSLMSETRAMAELAGYTTHRQLKPPVTRLSLYDVDETAAGKPPAWRVFDEIPAVDTEKYRGEENSIYNQGVYQYYTEPQRGRTYKLTMDTKQYLYRETPVGCLYFLPELQELSRIETTLRKGTPEESDLISYTRMSAAIFTGSGLYLVYNTERTAPTINRRGEELAEALATNWAQAVYQRSITELQNDYEGKVREVKVSPKVEGRLLLGDDTFKAALSVLQTTQASIMRYHITPKERERVNNTYNLRDCPNTYYLPVIRESIPLLAIMNFPHWIVYMKAMVLKIVRAAAERGEICKIRRHYENDGFIAAELIDNTQVIDMTVLRLDTVLWLVQKAMNPGKERYLVITMAWERPFWTQVFETSELERIVRLWFLDQEDLEEYVQEQFRENNLIYGDPTVNE
ncbi:hypothetical protein H9X81_10490 [Hydrogenoanaerobacterium saccharovorans]|uniref:Phage portal protein, SPP1 Gp6-like n=1 Tax=Hydrogenoanaerobacterium saccharovorans TaxID=474960 RepID=A0ABS2GPS2_9FIRM|nr:hypothetical protein [Hydrogenoanaerobacterium saccharovorans]MBM6924111.1 hypothetical protein [Hydrogenoanaerobacterium saccharovorans]